MIKLTIGAAALALVLSACVQQPPAATQMTEVPSFAQVSNGQEQGPEAAADMAGLYQRICLAAFPDTQAVTSVLSALAATPLDDAATRSMLHDDPGRGWEIRNATAEYRVTIESPPVRTCAIRRMTRNGLPTAMPYIAVMNAYARVNFLREGAVQTMRGRVGRVGADVQLLGTPLTPPKEASPAESSMYISTDYHGRSAGWGDADAAGGVGVEIRMAHQILPRPS